MLTLLTLYIIAKDKEANAYVSYYNKINNNEELRKKVMSSVRLIDEDVIRYFLG